MTPREARRARREAERKAKKAEFKRMKVEGQLVGATYSHGRDEAAILSEPKIQQMEFSPKLIAQANAARERVHRGAGISLNSQQSAAVPTPQPHPEPSLDWEANRDDHSADAAPRPGRSTGPRSIQGKATSSRNSFKHGLASGQLIVPGEDAAEYDALLDALLDEHQPANPTEEMLVRELAQSYWLMQRAMVMQNNCFTADAVDTKQLALFLRYHTTYERAFHRALNTLLRIKKDRMREFVSQSRIGGRQFVSQRAVETPSQPASVPRFPSLEDESTKFVSQQAPHAA